MSEEAPKENLPPFVPPVSSFTGPVGELIAQRMVAPPPRPGVLAVLDHFEIVRMLGGGGMGIVLLARDLSTNREAAIKMVKSDLVTNQHAVHRFLKETGHLKRLRHTNIVPVNEISDRPEGPYFVMPYFEKGSLASRIKPGRPLDTETILDIAIQIADGLSFAHRSGIIHRDLKPANILLGNNGTACLADFGLARTVFNDTIVDVESRQLEGTAPYVSPAIAAGDAEDTRCDIYSFGALLYEMLTGLPPYQGRGTKEILDQILAGPPKPILSLNPAADRGLVTVAEGCMARELRDRYADMRDVLKDLRRVQQHQEPIGVRDLKTPRRASTALVAALCLLAAALAGSAAWLLLREESPPAKNPMPTNSVAPTINSNAILSSNPVPQTNSQPPTNAPVGQNPPVQTTSNVPQPSVITNVPPVTAQPRTPTVPSADVQPIVTNVVNLAAYGLGENVISNYLKQQPPGSPLSAADFDYLMTNQVPRHIIDLLLSHLLAPAPPVSFTNQMTKPSPAAEVHQFINSANKKCNLRDYAGAVADCNEALKLDPANPHVYYTKGVAEAGLHNKNAARTAFTTVLNLTASNKNEFENLRSKATSYLRWLSYSQ